MGELFGTKPFGRVDEVFTDAERMVVATLTIPELQRAKDKYMELIQQTENALKDTNLTAAALMGQKEANEVFDNLKDSLASLKEVVKELDRAIKEKKIKMNKKGW